MLREDVRRQEGGLQEAQRLHHCMGELIWTCRSWHGLSAAAQHYSRSDDLTAYAAGVNICRPACNSEDVPFSDLGGAKGKGSVLTCRPAWKSEDVPLNA